MNKIADLPFIVKNNLRFAMNPIRMNTFIKPKTINEINNNIQKIHLWINLDISKVNVPLIKKNNSKNKGEER